MRPVGVGRIDDQGRPLLSIDQAAKFLRVSRRTVHRLLERGLIDSVIVSSKEARRLVPLDSLEAYKACRGLSLSEITRRLLELERKVAFLMTKSSSGKADPQAYDRVMDELRKRHPEFYD